MSEYQGKIGFRIFALEKKISPEMIQRYRRFPSPNVGDSMGRLRSISGLLPLVPGSQIVGRAVTVLTKPADNLMVHKALDLAEPGDVLVVSTCGDHSHSVWGGLLTRTAKAKGIAGIIVDGSARDLDDLIHYDFPVFARTVSSGGCFKQGPGEVNSPIGIDHLSIQAGDLMVADKDGIAVVPHQDIEEVAALTEALMKREEKRAGEIENENILIKPVIDETLRKNGVIV